MTRMKPKFFLITSNQETSEQQHWLLNRCYNTTLPVMMFMKSVEENSVPNDSLIAGSRAGQAYPSHSFQLTSPDTKLQLQDKK